MKILNLVKNPLFSGSAIMILGSNTVNALNYGYHFLMGRLLGTANYGELVALISLLGILGMIPGSINLVVIKYISSTKDKTKLANLIFWLKAKVLKISIIFSILIIIISPLITSFLHIEKLSYVLLVALSFIFSISAVLNRAILQGLLKFKDVIISLTLEGLVKLTLSVGLIFLGFKVGGAMIALIISVIVGWYLSSKYIQAGPDKKVNILSELKSMSIYAFPVFIFSIATTSLYSADLILVKHFFTSHEAGLYAALSTLGKIIFFGAGPIGSAMFPIISQRHTHGLEYKKVFIYSFLVTLLIALVILLSYYLFPKFAINLLYGSAYLESADLLVWFGIFITLFTLSTLVVNFNLSLGRTKVVTLPFLAALVQIVLIWLGHETLFDVIFVSIKVCALLLLGLLIYSIYANRKSVSNSSRF